MTKKSTNGLIGRDAGNGRYIPVEQARARPSSTVAEPRGNPSKPSSTGKPKGK